VDDEGVAQLRWGSPVAVEDDSADCGLRPDVFAGAEIFEKRSLIAYGAQATSANPNLDRVEIDVTITQVRLCLLYIKDQNNESKTGLLAPAWVFYGDIVSQTFWNDGTSYDPNHRQGMGGASGCGFYPGPTIVFAINAVDGSVVDPALGY
jgi:hypothetical protein